MAVVSCLSQFAGKSNLVDAISFALCLPLQPAKHLHTRELVYRAASDQPPAYEMSVQLNFSTCAFKRLFRDGVHEYSFLVNNREQPMTSAEYKAQITKMGLDIQEFCHYQDRLLLQFQKQRRLQMSETFESLSGSDQHKEPFTALTQQVLDLESKIRVTSDLLRDKRYEKIRSKGLSEYQKEIERCVDEQNQCSRLLAALVVYNLQKSVQRLEEEEASLAKTVDQNYGLQSQSLAQVKRLEAELRILESKLQEAQSSSKQLRADLLELQTTAYQNEKSAEQAKHILQQKRSLLFQQQSEIDSFKQKKLVCLKQLDEKQLELDQLNDKILKSPQLAQEQQLRDRYIDIKSKVQSTNAQIERETCKVDAQIQQQLHKLVSLQKELRDTEQRLGVDETGTQLPKLIQQTEQSIASKTEQAQAMRKELQAIQSQVAQKQQSLSEVERQILEAEFQLSEIEAEKMVKTTDAKVAQALKELKIRCRGFMGQMFELVKPINQTYDIAVKVSLIKCLKMLVVDTPESAAICSDFLKEKQISMEVLVLSNVPDRKLQQSQKHGATLVYEVVEVPRSEPGLERAVRYFLGEKVVCKDFKQAAELQKKGVKEIVTEDGTVFNRGLISGGQQSNIFKGQLGTTQIDKQIMKLVEQIQRLEQEHFQLKQSDGIRGKEQQLYRDLQQVELELDQLKLKKGQQSNQFKHQQQSQKQMQAQLVEQRQTVKSVQDSIEVLKRSKQELSSEVRAVEIQEFRQFCEQVNVQNIQEYESKIFANSLLYLKQDIEHQVLKLKTELGFCEQLESAQQEVLRELKQQIQEAEALAKVQRGDNKALKMQEMLKEVEEQLQGLVKEKQIVAMKQVKQKQDLDLLSLRDETLRKDLNAARLGLGRAKRELQDKDQADFDLSGKVDDDPELQVQQLHQRIKELERKEEQFNQHVAVIPESDETAILLTQEILGLKQQLDLQSTELSNVKTQLGLVREKRSLQFLQFFNQVALEMPKIYRAMTGGIGAASVMIADTTDMPFDSTIVFDFCPPGKRHGCEIEQLSGGEKSIAALSFVFALALVKRPPIIVMDEVDAFLDSDNVKSVTEYLKTLPAQVVIISHKEDLAAQSLSLVGVCMKETSSQTFALDLQSFD